MKDNKVIFANFKNKEVKDDVKSNITPVSNLHTNPIKAKLMKFIHTDLNKNKSDFTPEDIL